MPTATAALGDKHRRLTGDFSTMVKPEWGTKRSCPKCATRFYDLSKDEPVTCIECGYAWMPEPVLKSKQPMPFEVAVAVPEKEEAVADDDLAAEELVPDEDEEPSADDEVDLAPGEDDLGVATGDEDEEH
jgi:uncharacterized protein (TIGR02300 family)